MSKLSDFSNEKQNLPVVNFQNKASKKELIKAYKTVAKKIVSQPKNSLKLNSSFLNKIANFFSNKKSSQRFTHKENKKVTENQNKKEKSLTNKPSSWENVKTLKKDKQEKKALKLLLNLDFQPTENMRNYILSAIKMKIKPNIFSSNPNSWLLLSKKEAQALIKDILPNDLKKIREHLAKTQGQNHNQNPSINRKDISNLAINTINQSTPSLTANIVESSITSIAQSLEQGIEI